MDGQTDERTDRRTDRWTDGWWRRWWSWCKPAVILLSLQLLLTVTHSQQMSLVNIKCHDLLKQLIQSLHTLFTSSSSPSSSPSPPQPLSSWLWRQLRILVLQWWLSRRNNGINKLWNHNAKFSFYECVAAVVFSQLHTSSSALCRLCSECRPPSNSVNGYVWQNLTSLLTHYRSFRRWFYGLDDLTNSVVALKDNGQSTRSTANPTRPRSVKSKLKM